MSTDRMSEPQRKHERHVHVSLPAREVKDHLLGDHDWREVDAFDPNGRRWVCTGCGAIKTAKDCT